MKTILRSACCCCFGLLLSLSLLGCSDAASAADSVASARTSAKVGGGGRALLRAVRLRRRLQGEGGEEKGEGEEEAASATDPCQADTVALYDGSPELREAYAALEAEAVGAASCEEVGGGTETACSVDFGALTSSSSYAAACEGAGGRLARMPPAAVACTVSALQSFRFSYRNLAECVTPTCDEEKEASELQDALKDTAASVEASTDAVCSYDVEGTDGSSGGTEGDDEGSTGEDAGGSEPTEESGGGGGLTPGAKFGISVAVIAAVAGIGYGIWWAKKNGYME